MSSSILRSSIFLLTALGCGGCVVSTYGGPGTPPELPLPPEPEAPPTQVQSGPAEIGARHILISFKGASSASPFIERTKSEARAFAEELLDRVLNGEELAKLAEEFSDDRGSAQDGGSLGIFKRSDMVKPFADAAFALEVGEVADVVESPFGFHVIERTD